MELLKEKLKNIKYEAPQKKTEKRFDNEWTYLGTEMTKYFGTNCYWVAWKFPMWKIKEKFAFTKDNNKDFKYFLGCLKN